MTKLLIFIVLCVTVHEVLLAEVGSENSTEISGRSGRYGFPEIYQNRLPPSSFLDNYPDSPDIHPNKNDRYDVERSPPYEIPTGFDQFVPDKSSGPKYPYRHGGFYSPYPPNTRPSYAIEEIDDRDEVATTPYVSVFSRIKDLVIKVMRFLFGGNDPDSVLINQSPSLFTGIKEVFNDPMVALTAVLVPLGLLLANVVPFFTKLMMTTSLGPAVTTTIANTVARSLQGRTSDEVLNAIQEFGARAIEDPRCLQRFFCQAAKSHIESRSADSWSAQNIVRKLAKAVDEKLWDSFGLTLFFSSLQNGQCENLPCGGGDFKASTDPVLAKKLKGILSKLLNFTETEKL